MSLCKFRRGIEQAFDVLKTRQCDLKWSQRHCLSELQRQKDLTVFPADKNLGPSVSNRTNCIKQVLSEHLENADDCEHMETPSGLGGNPLETPLVWVATPWKPP